MIKEILRKYSGDLPSIISNQKMNKYLKEIGNRAGLKQTVTISITKGGMRMDRNYKKFELITVHTARRSFATNMFLAGITTISIMKITGHKTEKSFLKYIRISQEDNALKLAEHPFFKASRLHVVNKT
jgi:integrase